MMSKTLEGQNNSKIHTPMDTETVKKSVNRFLKRSH